MTRRARLSCPVRVQDAPRPREGMLPPAVGSDVQRCLTNLQPVFADNGHNPFPGGVVMASEPDRSVFVEPLPARPNLEMQQKRAKELLRAAWAGDADALIRIRALHPKPPAADALVLADAQLVVARGYGFESWAAMKRKIDSLTKTPVE